LHLPLNLSDPDGPTSSYSIAGIAHMVSEELKSQHNDKLGIESVLHSYTHPIFDVALYIVTCGPTATITNYGKAIDR
jgi:hypothetical protein